MHFHIYYSWWHSLTPQKLPIGAKRRAKKADYPLISKHRDVPNRDFGVEGACRITGYIQIGEKSYTFGGESGKKLGKGWEGQMSADGGHGVFLICGSVLFKNYYYSMLRLKYNYTRLSINYKLKETKILIQLFLVIFSGKIYLPSSQEIVSGAREGILVESFLLRILDVNRAVLIEWELGWLRCSSI